MKVGFIHDHMFYECGDKIYSRGGLPYNVLKRYADVFGEIVVMGRANITDNCNGLVESSGENVYFNLNKIYKGPVHFFTKYNEIRRSVSQLLDSVDGCIIRLPSFLGIIAIRECIKKKKPWAVEVVGCCWDSLWNYGNIQGKMLAPYMYLLNRKYIKKAKFAIYVSESFLQRRYPTDKITASASDVVINENNSNILLRRKEKIDKLDIKAQINIGLVGSLDVDYKGHKNAFLAVKHLTEKGYNVKLKCLGGGSTKRWLDYSKKLNIESNIEFCGVLPSGIPVLEWLDNIDVFIMPSLTEGLPRVLVESMSRACPCYGSRVGGIAELLKIENTFKAKSHRQLSRLVEKKINNKDDMKCDAIENFMKSKNYTKNKLDNKRNEFYYKFKSSIE